MIRCRRWTRAKVDGLARVLEKSAADRQVIVFTHDNRLAEAVRQLRLPATVLEVTRRPGSVVQVRECLDPVQQALRDAGALGADQSVPSEIAARVVPGLCRTALEAALTEVIWRRQLRDGRGHAEIEASLEGARVRLTLLAARAGGRCWPGRRCAAAAESSWDRSFACIYQALNRGAHGAFAGDPGQLRPGAPALVDKIRASLP